MSTAQIAAEAARRYIRKLDLPRSVRPQAVMDLTYEIKSAIEKAISYQPKSSEVPQSDDTKRLDWLCGAGKYTDWHKLDITNLLTFRDSIDAAMRKDEK